MTHISTPLTDTYEYINKGYQHREKTSGLFSGYNSLDKSLSGLPDSSLIVLGASPGMGKTSLALSIALNMAKASGKHIAYFSPGFSPTQLCLRLIAAESQVEISALVNGNLSTENWRRVTEAGEALSETNILCVSCARSHTQLWKCCCITRCRLRIVYLYRRCNG